jgi:hypothetical protein
MKPLTDWERAHLEKVLEQYRQAVELMGKDAHRITHQATYEATLAARVETARAIKWMKAVLDGWELTGE